MSLRRRHQSRKHRRRRIGPRFEALESRRLLAVFTVDSTANDPGGTCAADNPSGNVNCTIRAAVTAAENNPGPDTIQIPDGTYPTFIDLFPNTAQDFDFVGNVADPSAVVIDAGGGGRVVELDGAAGISNVSMRGLTIQNGNATDGSGGGGILATSNVSLSLDNVIVQNNVAGGLTFGGGINADGSLTITNSTIRNNDAGDSGGGVFASGGTVTITDSNFVDNDALSSDSGGGGLYLFNANSFDVTNTNFDNNTARGGAGGLESFNVGGSISGGTYTNNRVIIDPAAPAQPPFEQGGGAIAIVGTGLSTVTISDVYVQGNSAPSAGGIAVVDSNAVIRDSTIDSNVATSATQGESGGGGIGAYNSDDGPTLTIERTRVIGNTTAAEAGGVGAVDMPVTITDSFVDDNTATGGRAGGVGVVALTGVLSNPNTSTPLLSIARTTVSNNTSDQEGGGVAVDSAHLQLTNVTVTANTTINGFAGGVAYNNDDGTVPSFVNYSTIAGNVAPGDASNLGTLGAAPLSIGNSIVDNGSCSLGALVSADFNIDSGTSCGFLGANDLQNTDPQLGPLQDNGGPLIGTALAPGGKQITPTMAIGLGSPALDTANAQPPATDARGIARPEDGDGNGFAVADRGAFEAETTVVGTLTVNDVFVEEGNPDATVILTLDNAVGFTFTVNFTTVDGTATQTDDYTTATGMLTFTGTAGEQRTITVPITDDFIAENDEQLTVTLSGAPVSIDASDTGTLSIFDDDFAFLTVTDAPEANEDSGTLGLAVTLTGTTDAPFTVDVSTLDLPGGAVAGVDYTAVTGGTLTFAGNDSETQTFNVSVTPDTMVELAEDFAIEVNNIDAGTRQITFDNFADRADITRIGQFAPVGISPNDVALFTPDPFTTIAYVADDTGLLVLDVSDPTTIVQLGAFPLANPALAIDAVDAAFFAGVVYVAAGDSGLQVLDVSDPANITRLGSFNTLGQTALSLDREGTTVYLGETNAVFEGAVRILDVTNPSNITQSGIVQGNLAAVEAVLVDGTTAYIASDRGMEIVDVSNPAIPVTLGSFVTREGTALAAFGPEVYLGTPAGLAVLNVDNPAAIIEQGFFATAAAITSVDTDSAAGPIVTIAGVDGNVQILNVQDPANITVVGAFDLDPTARGFDVEGLTAYVATAGGGVQILRADLVASTTGRILNDDTATLSLNSPTVNEADGTARVFVSVDNAVDGGFTVDVSTMDDTAMAPGDYTDTTNTLTFSGAAGQTQPFDIPITDDGNTGEAVERFFVTLSAATPLGNAAAASIDTNDVGTVTINEAAAVVDVSIMKTDDVDPVLPAGTLTYTLDVTNAGPNDASAVTVTDTLPANLTFLSGDVDGMVDLVTEAGGVVTANIGALAFGASSTVTITTIVADDAVGTIDNTASVTSAETDANTANNSASESTLVGIDLSDDVQNIDEDEPIAARLVFDVLANDLPSGPLTITAVNGATLGVPQITGGGTTITYTPTPDAFGQDIFTYTASNGAGQVATADVTVNIASVNDGPTADPDVFTATDRGPFSITFADLTVNDSPGPANENQMVVVSDVANASANGGDLMTVGQSVIYTPDPAFTGLVDTFTYTASDGIDVATGTVTINLPAPVDLATSINESADPVETGGTITLTIPISNNGGISATNVVSTTTLPPEFVIINATVTPDGNRDITGNEVVTSILTLDPGATSTLTIVASVGNSTGDFDTSTAVTSDEVDANVADNSATETTTIVQPSSIFGHITCDANGNGVEDPGEEVVGTTVFLDADGDRINDPLERFTMTDNEGNYSFSNVIASTVTLVAQVPFGCDTIPNNPGVARSVIGVGDLARSIISVDIDGDGDRDILVASDASGTMSVLINDGGNFTLAEEIFLGSRPHDVVAWEAPGMTPTVAVAGIGTPSDGGSVFMLSGTAPTATLAAGNGPIEVALADFDNNGVADILAAAFRSSDVRLLMNGSPNALAIADGNLVNTVAVGDVNGDGNDDVVLGTFGYPGDESSQLSVLLGDGMGGFAAPITTDPIPQLVSVKVAELDTNGAANDHRIVALSATGQLIVYSLVSGSLVEIGSTGITEGANAFDTGDFNRDGLTDVAITNLGDQQIDLLIGNGTGGFALFRTITNVPAPSDIVADDFDGDGADDLAVSNLYQDANLGQPGPPSYRLPSTTTILRLDVAENTVLVSGSAATQVDFTFQSADPSDVFDVTGEGEVTALDALRVINFLSRKGEGEQVTTAGVEATDVNRDGKTSAIDALMIVNYLHDQAAAQSPVAGIDQLSDDDDEDDRIAAVDLVLMHLLN